MSCKVFVATFLFNTMFVANMLFVANIAQMNLLKFDFRPTFLFNFKKQATVAKFQR